MGERKQVNIRMEVDILERIDEIARYSFRTRSQTIHLLLTKGLEKMQEENDED